MLFAGAVIGAIDKRLGIACDPVEPLQMFTVRIEVLSLVNVTGFQRLAVAFEAICLYHRSKSDIFRCKPGYRRNLDIICQFHLQISGLALLILGTAINTP